MTTTIKAEGTLVEKLQALAGYMREVETITDATVNGKRAAPTAIVAEMADALATEVGALMEERDALLEACRAVADACDDHEDYEARKKARAAIAKVRS